MQCPKTPQICYLGQAEQHAKNRTSLCGLDHDTLFFNNPLLPVTIFLIDLTRFISEMTAMCVTNLFFRIAVIAIDSFDINYRPSRTEIERGYEI